MGDVTSPFSKQTPGFICGLQSEVDALDAPAGTLIGVSGARPDKATTEAERLIAAGADILVSFGLAGALSPELQPGDLLLPEAIVDEDGHRWTCASPPAGLFVDARTELLLGAETVIETPEAKAELAANHSAIAVDMESQRVAQVADQAGLPFLVIRAIADPAHRTLPPLARNAVDEFGHVRLGATIWGLAKRPWDLPGLLALGGDSKAAHAALAQAAAEIWA